MSYRLEIRRSAAKSLKRLPEQDRSAIRVAIEALVEAPRPPGVRKLKGRPHTWRMRVGRYRVIFELQEEALLIVVLRIGHRRDVYR